MLVSQNVNYIGLGSGHGFDKIIFGYNWTAFYDFREEMTDGYLKLEIYTTKMCLRNIDGLAATKSKMTF